MPIALIIIVVIGAVVGLLFFMPSNEQSPTDRPTEPPATYTTADTPATIDTAPAQQNTYKNGTYTADAAYFTPKRVRHNISVSVTIQDDVITTADVLYDGAEAKTPSHIGFDGAFEQAVLGAEMSDDINLARVGGASLTTVAFNEALADIASDASL